MKGLFAKLMCASAACSMAATPALADKANQLRDLNGERASGAENALEDRGFRHVSTHKSNSGYVNSYWWDERDDDCVVVEVYDGRVSTINDASDQDCGHHKGNDAAVAAAAIGGAALLGAIFSHKSHHKQDRNYDQDQSSEFERGYRDGLHNAAYHNYNRADAYAHGYERGTDERQANLHSHHHGRHHHRGGYAEVAQFADLTGARAGSADSELRRRGFTDVDAFKSASTAYTIWARPASRQCLQMTVADGRVYDIRDIGDNPKCR